MQKHTGPVRGLEFNAFSPNLLASGAEDGELCIWDLAKPTTPSLYPPLKGGAGQPDTGEVSFLAWNNKVQHILASSLNGTTVVWDLKRQRPVISFTDPNSRRRCSALQWNPEVATQLIVASDDDRSPSLQIWDLRNSISPAREFVGHSKGVLAMAWSQGGPRPPPHVRQGQPHALLGHGRGGGARRAPGELQLELRRAVVHDHAGRALHELVRRQGRPVQPSAGHRARRRPGWWISTASRSRGPSSR